MDKIEKVLLVAMTLVLMSSFYQTAYILSESKLTFDASPKITAKYFIKAGINEAKASNN